MNAPMTRIASLLLASLATSMMAGGCVQLVAFEQPLVGQPDIVKDPSAGDGAALCDPDVTMAETALCSESCEIDPASGETTCGERVRVEGARASVDVSGLHEVELTVTVCDPSEAVLRVEGHNGASVSLEGRALDVRAAAEANARPYQNERFLPESGCDDRTFVFQTGRMSLADSGMRLCSAHLVPVEERWTVALGQGLRGVELCFRAPRPARSDG